MLAGERDQIVCRLLPRFRPASRECRQAGIDQGTGKSVTMDRLPCVLQPFFDGRCRLLGKAAMPQRPRPDAYGGDPNVGAKPECQRLMLLGLIQGDRTI